MGPETGGWRRELVGAEPAERLAVVGRDLAECLPIVEAFLQAGFERRDLVAASAPRAERDGLSRQLTAAGIDVDLLIAHEEFLFVDAEDWYPPSATDAEPVASFLAALGDIAVRSGRAGATFFRRIAPSLFERGDTRLAMLAERTVHTTSPSARILCPYYAARLPVSRETELQEMFDCHTCRFEASGKGLFGVRRSPPARDGNRPR